MSRMGQQHLFVGARLGDSALVICIHIYVCMCMCTYIYNIQTLTCTHIYTHKHTHAHTHTHSPFRNVSSSLKVRQQTCLVRANMSYTSAHASTTRHYQTLHSPHTHAHTHILLLKSQPATQVLCMGWLRSVGSIRLQVSFAEYRLFYRALLQKRPVILSILLVEATP